nr:hypothetical protein Iba_chr03bCG16380 [Ipomoea batatas]GME01764.1 hypothetical protein Iba_scaffold1679139CG0010 [Ipomoea batatas]
MRQKHLTTSLNMILKGSDLQETRHSYNDTRTFGTSHPYFFGLLVFSDNSLARLQKLIISPSGTVL